MTDFLKNPTGSGGPSDHRRERPLVLVTDDHEDTRFLFRTLLTMRGYAVIEAADGEQAVLLAESSVPDLILMDSTLPRLDGIGATRRIRESNKGCNTPIVFISGRAEPKYRDLARDAGCDDFLVKPVSFDLFSSALDKHLGPLVA